MTSAGILFAATGSAADDFYAGGRPGKNLYADSILAIDARTGKLRWYFQAVHHDEWDDDFASPPVLVTVTRHGKKIDAVAATNKTSLCLCLRPRDRPQPVSHRRSAGAGGDRAGRYRLAHPAAPAPAAALVAPDGHAPTTSPSARPKPTNGRARNSRPSSMAAPSPRPPTSRKRWRRRAFPAATNGAA